MSTVLETGKGEARGPEEALAKVNRSPRVAYFSMEIALRAEIPTYAGGLGILAGDLMRSAADLNVAMVGVTLVSRRGYFHQAITPEGDQIESPEDWDPSAFASLLPTSVSVRIGSRDVWIDAWLATVDSPYGSPVPALLLAPPIPSTISCCSRYRRSPPYRKSVNLRSSGALRSTFVSALLALELLREELSKGASSDQALASVHQRTNFTTHTPVEAAHDRFPYSLAGELFGDFVDGKLLRTLGGEHELNVTRLALETSGVVNGVARERSGATLFEHPIRSVANGVHSAFWTCRPVAALYDRHVPEWRSAPEFLTRATRIPLAELLAAHAEAKTCRSPRSGIAPLSLSIRASRSSPSRGA